MNNNSGSWTFTLAGTGFGYGEQITLNGQPVSAVTLNSGTQITVSGIAPGAQLTNDTEIFETDDRLPGQLSKTAPVVNGPVNRTLL